MELYGPVLRQTPVRLPVDFGLFDTLGDILHSLDRSARPIPLLMPASTDGRHFARLGIQTYGFLPMQLLAE